MTWLEVAVHHGLCLKVLMTIQWLMWQNKCHPPAASLLELPKQPVCSSSPTSPTQSRTKMKSCCTDKCNSYLFYGPMMFQVPLQEVLVCLSVSLDISGGWSLYPRVMACGWSASSLLPYNSTHWASTRLFGYHTLLNMFVFVVLLSCFSVFVKLPVCPSARADSSCVVFIQFSYVNRKKENGFWSEVANCSYLYTCQMQPPGAVLGNTTILMSWSYVPLQLILAHKA